MLSACANETPEQKHELGCAAGTLTGAVLGGLAGSLVGGGVGQHARDLGRARASAPRSARN